MPALVPYTGSWSPEAFAGKQFIGVDFSHRSLVGADFSNSVCEDCDFSGSDLSFANFTNANLYRCNLNGAVLYQTTFANTNLTRATFIGAYPYGWQPDSSTNITYTRALEFEIEQRRRSSVIVDADTPDDVRRIEFGSVIEDSSKLCEEDYRVGIYQFTFSECDRRERAMQRSQVFNRLKRMYRENHNGELALHCLYLERFYLTRSFYRYSPLAKGELRRGRLRAAAKTAAAFAAEVVSGYGLRPLRVLRSLLVLFVAFVAIAAIAGESSSTSGVLYVPAYAQDQGCGPVQGGVEARCGVDDLHILAFYGLKSMTSTDPTDFVVVGWLAPVAVAYFMLALALFALLFSSLFVRLLNE